MRPREEEEKTSPAGKADVLAVTDSKSHVLVDLATVEDVFPWINRNIVLVGNIIFSDPGTPRAEQVSAVGQLSVVVFLHVEGVLYPDTDRLGLCTESVDFAQRHCRSLSRRLVHQAIVHDTKPAHISKSACDRIAVCTVRIITLTLLKGHAVTEPTIAETPEIVPRTSQGERRPQDGPSRAGRHLAVAASQTNPVRRYRAAPENGVIDALPKQHRAHLTAVLRRSRQNTSRGRGNRD